VPILAECAKIAVKGLKSRGLEDINLCTDRLWDASLRLRTLKLVLWLSGAAASSQIEMSGLRAALKCGI
jgi:hypothetical protein